MKFVKFAVEEIKLMKNKGIFICFTGTDGTGKTTLAKSLEESIKNSGSSCKYIWGGWRGFESFLFKPIVNIIRKKRNSEEKSVTMPRPMQNNFLFSYAAWFDYFLRVFPNLLISLYKYDLIILDRYVYDVAIGFSINTKKDGEKLLRRFFYIFPEPDITFLIDVPEEIAYSRKDDIPSVEYLYQQKRIYSKLLRKDDAKVLDGLKNKEELLDIVFKDVKEVLK